MRGRRAEFVREFSGMVLIVGSGGGRGGWEGSGLIIGMALVGRFGGMTEYGLEGERVNDSFNGQILAGE